MPGQTVKRRTGLKDKSPRAGVPLPGLGGYDYPRGQYGATGFPGSAPASPRTHTQTADGRLDRQLTTTAIWARDTGPEALDVTPVRTNKPQPSYSDVEFIPGTLQPGSRFIRGNGTPRQPRARQMRSTSPEQRMTPVIGGAPGSQNVRNQIAQRYKARPELVRAYRASPNPGKTGARLDGLAINHPGTMVHGHPDGVPVAGMRSNPGMTPPLVTVQSRFVSAEGAQEAYAVNRPLLFTKGGTPAPYPPGYQGNVHLRGARMDGMRYVGALAEQQRIGLASDAYGLSRARGPRHRPVSFEQPEPWTANFRDVPPEGRPPADMIRQSPPRPRSRRAVRRG